MITCRKVTMQQHFQLVPCSSPINYSSHLQANLQRQSTPDNLSNHVDHNRSRNEARLGWMRVGNNLFMEYKGYVYTLHEPQGQITTWSQRGHILDRQTKFRADYKGVASCGPQQSYFLIVVNGNKALRFVRKYVECLILLLSDRVLALPRFVSGNLQVNLK